MRKKQNNLYKPINNKNSKAPTRKKQAEIFTSKYPVIDYEKAKLIPEITITIRLDQGIGNLNFDIKVPVNSSLMKIKEIINELHGNACHNIKIYIIENSFKKYVDTFNFKSLQELGIRLGENLNFYYQYEPSVNALLQAGLV